MRSTLSFCVLLFACGSDPNGNPPAPDAGNADAALGDDASDALVMADADAAQGPTIVQDNFVLQPAGTRSFQASVRFSEPVAGVDANSVTIDGDAYIDAIQTTDQINYTFTLEPLHNATTYTVHFTAAIHDAGGLTLAPTTRALPIGGQVFYVVVGGRGTKDGSSPANAMASVDTAASAAAKAPGSDVWIAGGVYASSVDLTGGNAIYGGFDDTFTTRDLVQHATHLTGDVVLSFDSTQAADGLVDGVSLEGSHSAKGNGFTVYVHPTQGRLVLTRDTITSGGATYENQAIYTTSGNVSADACYLTASGSGGAAVVGGGVFTNSVLEAPTAVFATAPTVLSNDVVFTSSECVELRSTVTAANVVFRGSGSGTCISGSIGNISITRLENDAFFGFTTYYAGPTTQSGISDPKLLNVASALGAQSATGNVVVDPALDGSGVPTTSTPASVTTGGRDTSGTVYGRVMRDHDGAPRTVPYSIGAYER